MNLETTNAETDTRTVEQIPLDEFLAKKFLSVRGAFVLVLVGLLFVTSGLGMVIGFICFAVSGYWMRELPRGRRRLAVATRCISVALLAVGVLSAGFIVFDTLT